VALSSANGGISGSDKTLSQNAQTYQVKSNTPLYSTVPTDGSTDRFGVYPSEWLIKSFFPATLPLVPLLVFNEDCPSDEVADELCCATVDTCCMDSLPASGDTLSGELTC
jgi:hypothetical protein